MTVKSDVDGMITWYITNNKDVLSLPVNCRPDTLRRFAKKKRGGPYTYRGFELVPVKPNKVKPVQLDIQASGNE